MNTHFKKPSVLVAMSGGVDSSVACYLLKEAGYEVRGATIRTWEANGCESANSRTCCARDGVEDSRRVAGKLGIPYYVFNMEREFKRHVIDYFSGEYMRGRTPNPCIACNEHIKFRLFLKRAEALGMDYMATGHYAQIDRDDDGSYLLREGVDAKKDQSYVLFGLGQDVLRRTLLPVGRYRKEEIRRMARELGLANAEKPDSVEICFVPKNDYREFLEKNAGAKPKAGEIKDTAGKILGTHNGFYHFTVGQRRWLGISAPEPLYVKELRAESNEVIVGTKAEVFRSRFRVERINWIRDPGAGTREPDVEAHAREEMREEVSEYRSIGVDSTPFIRSPALPNSGTRLLSSLSRSPDPAPRIPDPRSREHHFHVKIRSSHPKAPAAVEIVSETAADVSFAEPQDAVTPGQAAVFYDGATVVGGGWIA